MIFPGMLGSALSWASRIFAMSIGHILGVWKLLIRMLCSLASLITVWNPKSFRRLSGIRRKLSRLWPGCSAGVRRFSADVACSQFSADHMARVSSTFAEERERQHLGTPREQYPGRRLCPDGRLSAGSTTETASCSLGDACVTMRCRKFDEETYLHAPPPKKVIFWRTWLA